MLDVVRYTGNEALHESAPGELVAVALSEDASPDLILALLGTANRLVEECISRPAQDAELWGKLPPSVVDGIQRRKEK